MDFAQKLDFIMSLTNTSNSALSKHTALDPSYISLLRRGRRSLPKQADYMTQLSLYLARQCTKEYQRITLNRTIRAEVITPETTTEKLAGILEKWFLADMENPEINTVGSLLTEFSRLTSSANAQGNGVSPKNEVSVFYGKEGKRQATIALFNMLLAQEAPGSLLLFSDESAEWMMENPAFYDAWHTLLRQIIKRGHEVKIIHKVSRDINEMLGVVKQWLPFYITGAVHPYYYPKLRDGVYKRSLTVVPGVASIISTWVGDDASSAANLMMTERITVDSFTNEFYSYLALCKPLIKIKTEKNREDIFKSIMHFETSNANSIATFHSLPAITMPIEVLKSSAARSGHVFSGQFYALFEKWTECFKQKLRSHKTTHIIGMLTAEEAANSCPVISGLDFITDHTLYYTQAEYLAHLKNTLDIMSNYPNYSAVPSSSGSGTVQSVLKCVEEQGTLVISADHPPIVFEINEQNMCAAFWDFMQELKDSEEKLMASDGETYLKNLIAGYEKQG